MTDVLTEARFWAQVMGDAKRTVHCPPDLESRIKGWVDARAMGGLITVLPNPACPPNRIFILDMGAIEAATRQAFQRKPKWTDLIGIDPDYTEGMGIDKWLEESRGEA